MVAGNGSLNRIGMIQTGSRIPVKQQSVRRDDFSSILRDTMEKSGEVKFSKHADLRLKARNINISAAQMGKLADAVDKADKKGVKDTLVLLDDIALVVNVRNRTVITAASRNELKENVFTNIDGAVIV